MKIIGSFCVFLACCSFVMGSGSEQLEHPKWKSTFSVERTVERTKKNRCRTAKVERTRTNKLRNRIRTRSCEA